MRSKRDCEMIEEKACAILRHVFPDEFSLLKTDDKPDLQDKTNGIGIEVVEAVYDDGDLAQRDKINHKYIGNDVPIREIERLQNLDAYPNVKDGKLISSLQACEFTALTPHRIIRAISEKSIKAHKGNYDDFNDLRLYIYDATMSCIYDELKNSLLEYANDNFNIPFKIIYIYSFNNLFVFDVIKKNLECFNINTRNKLH